MLTPSYAAYSRRVGAEGADLRESSVERVLVAGERRGEPAFRAKLEEAWGRGSPRRWGSATSAPRCGAVRGAGRHALGARGFVHPELIDGSAGGPRVEDGAAGELS